MSDRRPPYAWDDEEPVRVTALRPLERTSESASGWIVLKAERTYPVGDFLDKITGRWVRCTMRDYLRSIGWKR